MVGSISFQLTQVGCRICICKHILQLHMKYFVEISFLLLLLHYLQLFWKLHHYFENNSIELYNLKEDVSESNNLSEENKEKTNELFEELNKWRKLNNAPIPYKINPDYDPIFVDSLLNLIENKKIKKRIS